MLLIGMADGVAAAPTLRDFGYRSMWCDNNPRMSAQNNLATNQRPMLVIVVQFDAIGPLDHDINYYSNFVFKSQAMPSKQSISGYFNAVSNGRFSWKPGSVIGPIHLNKWHEWNQIQNRTGLKDGPVTALWASNVVWQAMQVNPGAFEACDTDGNGWVTQDEGQVAIFSNENAFIGGTYYHAVGYRECYDVPINLCKVGWSGNVAEFVDWTDFATACHEVGHSLGCEDIYPGGGNAGVSVMGSTGGTNDTWICYMDPWHRMRAGWCEPRVYDLRSSSNAWITAAQVDTNSNAPIILWDSASNASRFWMLEFRNPNLGGYDRDAGRFWHPNTNGLALWYVAQNANHSLVVTVVENWDSTNVYRVDLNCGPGSPPDRGNGSLWGSDTVTRDLSSPFASEGTLPIRVRVDPFAPTATRLHVTWGRPDVWVDFSYAWDDGNGSEWDPFITLARGVAGVLPGGTIHVVAGHSPEKLRITKPLHIQSKNGIATIGR